MNNGIKLVLSVAAAAALAGCSASSSGSAAASAAPESAGPAATTVLKGTQKVVVVGDDWGTGIVKTVVTTDGIVDVKSVSALDFEVIETKMATDWSSPTYDITEQTSERIVTNAYLCDAEGERIYDETGSTFAIEMYVDPNVGGAMNYDMNTSLNDWYEGYKLEINVVGELTSAGVKVESLTVAPEIDLHDNANKIMKQVEVFDEGTWKSTAGKTYSYASYTPGSSEKRPLVIWLHGGGEGGTDPNVTLLANEVTAFVSDEFQSTMGGAYVFVPQCPTFWMDDGDGLYVQGWSDPDFNDPKGADSIYVTDLQEMIEWYVAQNPDVDTDRIILGGCSNGGYMTVRMMINKPGYYYKAYLSSESFIDSYLTDEDISNLSDTGMWFVYCTTDYGNPPELCSEPTIERLLNAGNEDIHVSEYETVEDTTGRFTGDDGMSAYQYDSHWTWVHLDNNVLTDDDDPSITCWNWMAE